MNGKTVSVVEDLRLVDIEQVEMFYVRDMVAGVVTIADEARSVFAIPGSVEISSTNKNGLIANEINFLRSDLTAATLSRLSLLRTRRLIAFYRDAHGNERICGSVTWPLALTFVADSDGIRVTLTGTSSRPDLFRAR